MDWIYGIPQGTLYAITRFKTMGTECIFGGPATTLSVIILFKAISIWESF